MAENFNLIFGSQAPTTATWTDADYQTGWSTVGSTPPTAEQFDFLQNRADMKAKELNDALTPLVQKSEADGRQAGTIYAAGACVTVDGLPNGWLLECVVPGTSGTVAITLPDPLIDGATIVDGNVTWALRKVATNGGLGYRQPSTAYTAGQIAYHASLPTGWCLKCTTAGTTADTMLDCSANKLGDTVTDGTVVWTVEQTQLITTASKALADLTPAVDKVPYFNSQNTAALTDITDAGRAVLAKSSADELLQYVVPNNAGAHNAIYRGNDLTSYWNSGQMSTDIQNGNFRNVYPGDYITKSITIDGTTYNNVKFIIMELDPHLHKGHTETTAHHVAIMPEELLGMAQMNAKNTTVGGYLGSAMWTTYIPKVVAGFEAAFGAAHILEHTEMLSSAMDANMKSSSLNGWSGASSGWAWTRVKVNLANENMVYGARVASSSFYDTGEWNNQLAAFRLNPGLICSNRDWWWLRSVANSSFFCWVAGWGLANGDSAANPGGVRPIALLH